MTKVIAIVSEKGGSGKTATAVNLAVAAVACGHRAAIFDLDPRAPAAVWGDKRNEGSGGRDGKPPPVWTAQAPRLSRLLQEVRAQRPAFVFVDTPANAIDIAEAACKEADFILIPCRPSAIDLGSIIPTVAAAQRTGKPFHVVITQAPHQGSEVEETMSAVTEQGVKVCPVVLHNLKAFTRRFNVGMAAVDVAPTCAAALETQALLTWLCAQARVRTSAQAHTQARARAHGGARG